MINLFVVLYTKVEKAATFLVLWYRSDILTKEFGSSFASRVVKTVEHLEQVVRYFFVQVGVLLVLSVLSDKVPDESSSSEDLASSTLCKESHVVDCLGFLVSGPLLQVHKLFTEGDQSFRHANAFVSF